MKRTNNLLTRPTLRGWVLALAVIALYGASAQAGSRDWTPTATGAVAALAGG